MNKLFAFGGDCMYAEQVYGHLTIAREGIARALSDLVEEKVIREEDARFIAKRILRDNAVEFFRLEL